MVYLINVDVLDLVKQIKNQLKQLTHCISNIQVFFPRCHFVETFYDVQDFNLSRENQPKVDRNEEFRKFYD